VWLVELAPIQDSALVATTIAAIFGLPEVPDRTPLEVLTNYLQRKQLLLLLDNCEHVIATCAEAVERLLRACPELQILATSREALGVAGEIEWAVTALRTPELPTADYNPIQAHAIQSYEAVHLFLHRAQTAKSDFVLSEQNAPAIAQICSQLDGMPLALELAAARLKGLTVAEVAARLQDRFALLSGGRRTAMLRHQTLRAAIDWSYDLLTESEKA
jgi:predicted ATPase